MNEKGDTTMYHYAEMLVGDRVIHRFPCATRSIAERCARAFIADLWPETGTIESSWDFHHAPFLAFNDLGEIVVISAATYAKKLRCGTYIVGAQ